MSATFVLVVFNGSISACHAGGPGSNPGQDFNMIYKKQLVYWRRINLTHIYAEYKDNEHQPEVDPLHPKGHKHGHRHISQVMTIAQFEIRHCIKVDDYNKIF